jgi:hypothetical protein
VFFQTTIYKVKIIDLKKIRLYEVSSKVATFVRKCCYLKILKWQKVSHQEKKNRKIANLSKCTDPLKGIVGAVVIFNHGLKFGIIFLVSDHPAHVARLQQKKSILRMWATIIGLFFTHFQVKFLRNLASEIIFFFPNT